MPVFDQLAADPDGRIWVRRYNVPWADTTAVLDVHDGSGKWLGSLRVPASRARLHILDVGRDYILLHLADEHDVPRVMKYRLLK